MISHVRTCSVLRADSCGVISCVHMCSVLRAAGHCVISRVHACTVPRAVSPGVISHVHACSVPRIVSPGVISRVHTCTVLRAANPGMISRAHACSVPRTASPSMISHVYACSMLRTVHRPSGSSRQKGKHSNLDSHRTCARLQGCGGALSLWTPAFGGPGFEATPSHCASTKAEVQTFRDCRVASGHDGCASCCTPGSQPLDTPQCGPGGRLLFYELSDAL